MASKSMQRTTPRDACGRMTASDQLQPLQTRMPVLADDDVVVHGNAERGDDLDDRLGHMDIGLRGRRIAGGMVDARQVTRFFYPQASISSTGSKTALPILMYVGSIRIARQFISHHT